MTKRERRMSDLRFATRAVHGGEHMDISPAVPTVNPLHVSTSFIHSSAEDLDAVFVNPAEGYAYGRFGNPTIRALETAMAAVENTDDAIAYPSGMAAIAGVFTLFAKPGDHVLVSRDVYGATLTLMNGQMKEFGVIAHFVDVTDLEAVEAMAAEVSPTMIYAETVSNPLIKVTDVSSLVDIGKRHNARVVIDNTFASPMLIRPTDLGADLVLHSTTKYIAGHGDVLGGVVSGSADLIKGLRDLARFNGAVPGPFDAWLCSRGLKTLHLRMREHSANARALAAWLRQDDRIETVHYPDVATHRAQFLSDDRGGMIGFEVRGMDRAGAFRYLEALSLIEPATTLGDVYSLSLYPAAHSHRGLSAEQRADWGIGDNLLRLSVGIEDADDIIADLDQALSAAIG